MKFYKVFIEPLTSFAYPIKGDLLYGVFNYWAFKLKKGNFLEKIVFSDFLPKGFFPKPYLGMDCFNVDEDKRKEFKKIRYVSKKTLEDLSNVLEDKLTKNIDGELKEVSFYKSLISVRNALNRFTNTTDENFSVFSEKEIVYTYEIELYLAVKDSEIEEVISLLDMIGSFGIGGNSNLKGKFKTKGFEEIKLEKSKYGIALSPIVTDKLVSYEIYTKYGKYFASSKPFKKIVVFADSGSVVEFDDFVMGENVENGYSKVSIIQGKSIIFPLKGYKNEN